MSSILTWGEIEKELAGLSPELKAQPALVQIQRSTEDWGEVRPLRLYTNGFKSGDWVLTMKPDDAEMETMSRESFDEMVVDYEGSHDEPPTLVRPLLIDQPMLLAEFYVDEETEALLRADDIVQARPVSVTPLFETDATKPPIGLKPYKLWLQECGAEDRKHVNPEQATIRFYEVAAAILRSVAAGWGVNPAHQHEYREWLILRGQQ